MSDPVLLSPREAAQLLGVSRSTVQRWIDSGAITAHRTIGGHRRVSEDDLRRVADEHAIPLRAGTEQGGIMFIDDDPRVIATLELLLRRHFPRVPFHSTSDSFAAGALVATHRPRVLLLDLSMPGIDGIAICRSVRQMPRGDSMHIAALTAFHADKKLTRRFTAAGGERIFAKPFDTAAIVAYIEQSLRA